MKRRRREYECTDRAAMLRRFLRSYGEHVGQADPVDLAEMVELREHLEAAIAVAVAGQRETFSWAVIGEGLGLSRQAVQQRYGGADPADRSSRDIRHSAA